MPEPTVGLALIAKDEEESLPRLLASIEGAFDQVVLLDTGSTDRTVEAFRAWAKAERAQHGITWETSTFGWIDDFGAARRAADELLDTDWNVWADCDDEIVGAARLRDLAAGAEPHVDGFVFAYNYAQDPNGNSVCRLKRERLIRAGRGEWKDRVHEAQVVAGAMVEVPADMVEWVHRPNGAVNSNERNLEILRGWIKDEPENPRVLGYLGTEELIAGRHADAIPYFERYLALRTGWDDERAQIHRKLALCLMEEGRHEEAIATAFEALRLVPSWPDSYLTLAEAHYHLQEPQKAVEWARQALERGIPDTLLIINPLDYVFQPKVVMAGALGALGRISEALEVAEEALAIVPQHEGLREGYMAWSSTSTREATAKTWVGAAELLVRHDEQLKALRLLEDSVPYFATDHPAIVSLRSELRERVRPLLDPDAYDEHYRTGGSKPEDMIPDDAVDRICEHLPRCRFLLEGVEEQLREAREGVPA